MLAVLATKILIDRSDAVELDVALQVCPGLSDFVFWASELEVIYVD